MDASAVMFLKEGIFTEIASQEVAQEKKLTQN